ncbi:reverse transcriptase domain-containing protein [Tanacetum coccineum]|uniref:Reverse transcriptase domain-containing protein n=1 Tax=Tanacetum coccineum TaxID=301880 RepID=A0ABQ4ZZ82_9ASTR
MRTRSSSNLVGESSPNPTTSNPKRGNRRPSKQPFSLEESPVDTMADQRTMAKLLRAPTEGYAEAIVVPPIFAEHFELKHSLINMMTSDLRKTILMITFCLAVNGNTFPEFQDNIQGYVSAAAVNYNQVSSLNTIANPKGELKAITTRSGLVLDGPSVPMPPPFINPEEDERAEETLTDPELAEYTIKVPPPLVQKAKPTSLKNYVVHKRDPLHPNIPKPSRMHQEEQQDNDEIQIHKFWQMFKQLHINISLADALILIPKYQKMLKSLLSNKEKLLELANTPLNENCSAVILKKLPEKLGDPGKFLIPCGFSELKCKALADLGASINLMPLSVWKKLGLPELISTRMTLELANRAICTPAGIARDVFVPVGSSTYPADIDHR